MDVSTFRQDCSMAGLGIDQPDPLDPSFSVLPTLGKGANERRTHPSIHPSIRVQGFIDPVLLRTT